MTVKLRPVNYQRRRFIKALAAGGVAYAVGRTPGTSFAQMTGVGGFSDYRALVCLFLFGGNDSWNMLIPTTTAEYNAYARSRAAGTSASLAVDKDALLPVTPTGAAVSNGFGFHPKMPEVRRMFMDGRAAILPNVGPLMRLTSKAEYQAANSIAHELPPQLFSHNDQQDQWLSLRGNKVLKTGWAGRVADVLAQKTSNQQIPMNVSLFGQSLFQASETVDPYVMGISGVNTFSGLDGDCCLNLERRNSVNEVIAATIDSRSNSYYHRAYARVHDRALRYADRLNASLSNAYKFNAFPEGTLPMLGTQLRTVARLISQRATLGMSRQIFLVAAGGYDTHDSQLTDHPKLLGELSASIKMFDDAMTEIGLSQQVTLFTQSDFGRTLSSNGDGSDHGWGGTQLVVGGAVRGGRFFGDYPVLETGGPLDVGSGILIPTLSTDQYAATLATWFGVADRDVSAVAPYIDNFAIRNLGFLA